MSCEPNQNLEALLFDLAVQKPTAAERAAFLDGVCQDNPALRATLDELLAAHFGQAGFLPRLESRPPESRPSAGAPTPPVPRPVEVPARMIGRYKLLEKIGEGGFGDVWMAEQREPIKRRVALKIIKPGMDSRQVVARFEAERQALALMDHPNIAKILDAGTTQDGGQKAEDGGQKAQDGGQKAEDGGREAEDGRRKTEGGFSSSALRSPFSVLRPPSSAFCPPSSASGRPYFVMELVRGLRITDYCDQHHVSTADRLGLFIQVCHAVQHAHQKGIIHRDLKPSNILVTLHDGVPVPKVIDFGIAKAIQQELTDKTLFTQFSQIIGTPAYLSPEQAETSGLDIDTRSDIYSLGVLLYELLVGRTPFDPAEMLKGGIEALRQVIRQKEPVKPSTKLKNLPFADQTAMAQRRRTEPIKLTHQLRGDLDWIVLKCLEKDRTRRYETANALAMDLQRHLDNEPVVARPPSPAYRIQKAWQRNKVACSAGVAVALALVLGTGISAWQAVRATRAERLSHQRWVEVTAERDARERATIALEARHLELRQTAYKLGLQSAMAAVGRREYEQPAREILDRCEPSLRGWEWAHLHLQMPFVREIQGPAPYGALLTRNAAHVVSAGTSSALTLWDAHTGARLRDIHLPDQPTVMTLSLDDRSVVVGSTNGFLRMHDLATGAVQWEARAHATRLYGVAIRPDGSRIASCAFDGAVVLRDVSGRSLRTNQIGGRPRGLAFSPDGRSLLVGSVAHPTRLLAADSLAEIWRSDAVPGGHQCVAFSPDGGRFVTGGADGFVRVWDTARREVLVTCALSHRKDFGRDHFGIVVSNVSAVAFSPDGHWIASAGQDQVIRLWDAASGRLLDTFPTKVAAPGWLPMLQFSPDGGQIMAAGGNTASGARFWNLHHRRHEALIPGHSQAIWSAAFTPDSQHLLTAGWDRQLILANAGNGRTVRTFRGHSNDVVWSVAITPDGRRAVSASQDGTLRVWDLETAQTLRVIPVQPPRDIEPDQTLFVAMSPDGQRVVSGGQDGSVQAWDLNTGVRIWSLANRVTRVWSIAWSADSRRIAVGGHGGRLTLVDAQQGTELWRTNQGTAQIVSLAFRSDGRQILTGAMAVIGSLCLWDTESGRLLRALDAQPGSIRSVAFSPDGRRLASAGHDRIARIWDARSFELLLALPEEPARINFIGFSPDGKRLAVGRNDGQARVWQTEPPAAPAR